MANETEDAPDLGPLARNVERLRTAAGLTQTELANATGVMRQGEISKIEKGATRMLRREKQEALARVLGVSVDALFADTTRIADASFSEFLASDFASDITEQEKLELSQTQWAKAGAPPAAWYHVLQALRLVRERRKPQEE